MLPGGVWGRCFPKAGPAERRAETNELRGRHAVINTIAARFRRVSADCSRSPGRCRPHHGSSFSPSSRCRGTCSSELRDRRRVAGGLFRKDITSSITGAMENHSGPIYIRRCHASQVSFRGRASWARPIYRLVRRLVRVKVQSAGRRRLPRLLGRVVRRLLFAGPHQAAELCVAVLSGRWRCSSARIGRRRPGNSPHCPRFWFAAVWRAHFSSASRSSSACRLPRLTRCSELAWLCWLGVPLIAGGGGGRWLPNAAARRSWPPRGSAATAVRVRRDAATPGLRRHFARFDRA